MSVEELTTFALQVFLIAIWTLLLLFTGVSYLRESRRRSESPKGSMTLKEAGVYALFMLVFLPATFLCLPMIASLPLHDVYSAPAVMAWLVVLFSGFLGFHVGMVPQKVAWREMMLTEGYPTPVDSSSGDMPEDSRRNV